MVEVWLDPPVSTLMDFSEPPTMLQQDLTLLPPCPLRTNIPRAANSQETAQNCRQRKTWDQIYWLTQRKADNGGAPCAKGPVWAVGGKRRGRIPNQHQQIYRGGSHGAGTKSIDIFHHKLIFIKHISQWEGSVGIKHAGQKKNHPENLGRLSRLYESFSLKSLSMSFDSLLSK